MMTVGNSFSPLATSSLSEWNPEKSTLEFGNFQGYFIGPPKGDASAIPTSQQSSGSSGGWIETAVGLFGTFWGSYQGAKQNSGSVVVTQQGCDPGINPAACKPPAPGPTGPVQPAASLNSAIILFLIALVGVILLVRR